MVSENALAGEKSPYLLQHKTNPVDWRPWGEAAFAEARAKNRAVFLSVGYSTCHWCHVMAHESFEDHEVADLLNRHFICIKVDREERPDIDSAYMQICQMVTGQGGWPLTLIMAPDKRPFFAATYLPKDRRFSLYGLIEILPRIAQAWHRQRTELLESSEKIMRALSAQQPDTPVRVQGNGLLDEGYEELVLRFDPEYGGFGPAPKFPTPHLLLFLLRYWKRTGKRRALDMAEKTLDAVRDGGICDQIGGGFHRYSTDVQWRVPHFEKMLYDQALLLMAYTEAFQATGHDRYRSASEEIIAYVLRDLRSPEGAFCSAEDADSPGGEGAFYLWTPEEMVSVLGQEDGTTAARLFGVRLPGNCAGSIDGDCTHVLYRSVPIGDLARSMDIPESLLTDRLVSLRARMFAAREKRPRPSLDDKVLADWNGLFIAALAKAARVFKSSQHRAAAEKAMAFLLERMRTPGGRLVHRFRDGEAAISAFADD
ncbi:MAG: thioredoxin domain-containing protein, partial [Terrimicrobiaceae bacterium]|nr:thioredoxin domain-containing protein [Terrimicrobiaceae bacterium]